MAKSLALSLIIVALIIGMGLGYIISPEYSMNSEDEHSFDLGNADRNYDLRFIDSMISHHMGAVEMAEEASEKSKNKDIQELSKNIISAQEKEIDKMYEWKEEWYGNTSKVEINDYSMNVNLGEYDSKFDLRFMNAMIAHHNMAIEMAKDAQKKSTRNEILNLADAIITNQNKEIVDMQNWREELYSIEN
jgi:uncharacterized protein (DUF305 family)